MALYSVRAKKKARKKGVSRRKKNVLGGIERKVRLLSRFFLESQGASEENDQALSARH
jgi:hypothetical protein